MTPESQRRARTLPGSSVPPQAVVAGPPPRYSGVVIGASGAQVTAVVPVSR
ncbi:hypothetical protein C8K38_103242 [Rhodococcus sp. OK611]|nr:hypothetical protein C8K38_103242 [Rhodococcus sp. OK611]SNX90186.1 hypothetical protein SAMN05447004_104242 [Rhodococcus sp. OK270]